MTRAFLLSSAAAVCLSLGLVGSAADQSRFDSLANLPFKEGRPTPKTAKTLKDELLFQRASQIYLWALPVINLYGMKEGSEAKFGAGYNVLPVFKKRLDAKTLITTPNSDVIYALSYVDVGKDGPLVFEAPPGLQGMFLDVWQRPITGPTIDGKTYLGDIGLPGPDKGKGGNFLILPPGYKGDVPDGYYVYRSETNNVFIFLRTFYDDPKDLSKAVGLMEAVKIYPLGHKDTAKAMKFPDASGIPVNMLPRSDVTAFEQLKRLLDSDVDTVADPDWRGMLASTGIVWRRTKRWRGSNLRWSASPMPCSLPLLLLSSGTSLSEANGPCTRRPNGSTTCTEQATPFLRKPVRRCGKPSSPTPSRCAIRTGRWRTFLMGLPMSANDPKLTFSVCGKNTLIKQFLGSQTRRGQEGLNATSGIALCSLVCLLGL
jgi:hypothetical protein